MKTKQTNNNANANNVPLTIYFVTFKYIFIRIGFIYIATQ